jgi:hypothetical protein
VTAVDQIDCYRIDHQGFVPEIFAGLLLTALYLMQIGPNIPNLDDRVEDWLVLALFAGSVIGLVGVVLGTKWFFRRLRRRVSYLVELVALPFMILALAGYTYASVDSGELLVSALSGGLGLTIEIGLVRLFVDLVEDLNEDHSEHGHD